MGFGFKIWSLGFRGFLYNPHELEAALVTTILKNKEESTIPSHTDVRVDPNLSKASAFTTS